ncbi:CHAT domain-containing protein [Streptomyces sp. NPDC004270]
MPLLTIRHYDASGTRMVDLAWSAGGFPRFSLPFDPQLSRFDLEDLRWYHENYRSNWAASSESAVQRIRGAERKIGEALHAAMFSGEAQPLADAVRRAGSSLRIEIRDELHDAATPWETMADPAVAQPLALLAASLVRTIGPASEAPKTQVRRARYRVLLLISRPGGVRDIGYWSVAYELWRKLSPLPAVQVDVLRPSTYDALETCLRTAADENTPYTAVHFDGHGTILAPFGGTSHAGYLLFDTEDHTGPEYIDGATLGHLLATTGVQLLSMNACRSADSAGGDRHLRTDEDSAAGQPSIVEEVLAAGVPACVGMRREVYPATPSRFFPVLYSEFLGGSSVGEAARTARIRLRDEPFTPGVFREASAPIDDWSIPVVGQRTVVNLVQRDGHDSMPHSAASAPDPFPAHLQAPPLVGCDDQVLLLEMLQAQSAIVLVHGPVLSGKSRLAVEYAKWLSGTSPQPRRAHYVDLSEAVTPEGIAVRIAGRVAARAAECVDRLRDDSILILDQADLLGPATQAFLSDLLTRVDSKCRVLVTARAHDLPWLPAHERITPGVLPATRRAELAKHWAQSAGGPYDARRYRALEFFSGGHPGVLLLLLGASRELIDRGEARDRDISAWLAQAAWEQIARLAQVPGLGPVALSVETLISRLAADLKTQCSEDELRTVPFVARFNVCCDTTAVARLHQAVTEAEASEEVAARTMNRLANAGLTVDTGPARLGALLHPLLKLVASRLPADPALELDEGLISTAAEISTALAARFRQDTAAVVWALMLHQQNLAEALWLALERRRFEAAAQLIDGLLLHCRYEADVELASSYLDNALPYFIDTRTGVLRPELREIGRRVWEHAMWVGLRWPRTRDPMYNNSVTLSPSGDDHYADGLFFRAVGRYDKAYAAFSAELREPSTNPGYSPGDVDWYVSEMLVNIVPRELFEIALKSSQISYAARLPDDAIGRSSSLLLEASMRISELLRRPEFQFADDDVTARIEFLPEDLASLDTVAGLLRDAQKEVGGQSAENRYKAAILWSTIMLARGDLTSAVSHFEECVAIMIALDTTQITRYTWRFALDLIRHGWLARGHETAQAAFAHAMRGSDHVLATHIRKFCERLETRYPELAR